MRGKRLAILIGVIIYVAVVVWGVGQGYSVGASLMWPLGLVFLALFGWASLWTRK